MIERKINAKLTPLITLLDKVTTLGWLLAMGVSMSACAMGGTSWKEEVQLHDGKKIVVERSQTYGGRNEPGQPLPIKEHIITFTLPNANKTLTWTSEYSEDIGRTNFNLLAVHVLNGTPYIVASPNLCLSYNKWGRPNPPYVFFKYDGQAWQRIPLSEFPVEFKTINMALGIRGREVEELNRMGWVSAEKIKALNAHIEMPEFKTILREAYPTAAGGCPEMIYDGHGGWLGIDWFTMQPTYEACLGVCTRNKISSQYCPCEKLFKGGK